MKIYQDITQPNGELSLALGFFDGLHKGHQSVISAAVQQKKHGLIPAMLTFSDSPHGVLSKKTVPRLMTRENRYELLEQLGIEALYELDFESIRNIPPNGPASTQRSSLPVLIGEVSITAPPTPIRNSHTRPPIAFTVRQ